MCWAIASTMAEDQPSATAVKHNAAADQQAGKSITRVQSDARPVANSPAAAEQGAPDMDGAVQFGDGRWAVPMPKPPRPSQPDLGGPRACVNGYQTDNYVGYISWVSTNEIGFDDFHLATTDRELCTVTIDVHSYQIAPPYDMYMDIWSGLSQACFDSSYNGVLLGSKSINVTAAGWQTLTYDFTADNIVLPARNPTYPYPPCAPSYGDTNYQKAQFWIGLHSPQAGDGTTIKGPCFGLHTNAPAELGCSSWAIAYCTNNTGGTVYTGGFGTTIPGMFDGVLITAQTRPGACCDIQYGTCRNVAGAAECTNYYERFTPVLNCSQVTCVASTGACCTMGTNPPGTCAAPVNIAACLGPTGNNGNKYIEGATTCTPDPFDPDCGKGACCVGPTNCVNDTTQTNCLTPVGGGGLGGYLWFANKLCSQIYGCALVPTNDRCANAIPLSGTCVTATFDSTNATYTAADVTNDAPTCLAGPPAIPMINDIWYKYQIPSTWAGSALTSARLVISTIGSQYDTVVVLYAKAGAFACGVTGAIDCPVAQANQVECSDDVVLGEIQTSYVLDWAITNSSTPRLGGCMMIRVGGLQQEGNRPGGPGQLNIDVIPTGGGNPGFSASAGVCCLTAGGCTITNTSTACRAVQGYFRSHTDFFEQFAYYDPSGGLGTWSPPEYRAGGCCHGTGPGEYAINCQDREYCAKAQHLGLSNSTWSGLVSKVQYFRFETRPLVNNQPYGMTIDTCGSDFDTVLSVYRTTGGTTFTNYGECIEDTAHLRARNDDCTYASQGGAQGKVSCIGSAEPDSCLCLTVGSNETSYNLMAGNYYYIGVGAKDTRSPQVRLMGVDPVPNYPINPAVNLVLTLKDNWPNCLPCVTVCACKGDMNSDSLVDGKDIQPWIEALVTGVACTTDLWCRANMNGDGYLDLNDLPTFVAALLYGYNCTPGAAHCAADDPDQPLYCNVPDGFGHGCHHYILTTSDKGSGYVNADNFSSPTGGLVSKVCWWGTGATNGWNPCASPGSPPLAFDITYYTSTGGMPGAKLAGPFAVTATATAYSVDGDPEIIPGFNRFMFEATHANVLIEPDKCYWIEIAGTGGTDCRFVWEMGPPGDGKSAFTYTPGTYPAGNKSDFDLAFCVNIEMYSNGCGNIACEISGGCTGTPGNIETPTYEVADCTQPPPFVDGNQGCSANLPLEEVFTAFSMTNNQTITICGNLGSYKGAVHCDANDDCPTGKTCVGYSPGPPVIPGTCSGGPYDLRDMDWYKLNLTGGNAYVSMTLAVENQLFLMFTSDGLPHGTPLCVDTDLFYMWEVGCTGTPCATGTVGGTTAPVAYQPGNHLFFITGENWVVPCNTEYSLTITTTVAP
jgi:hypothetical protein